MKGLIFIVSLIVLLNIYISDFNITDSIEKLIARDIQQEEFIIIEDEYIALDSNIAQEDIVGTDKVDGATKEDENSSETHAISTNEDFINKVNNIQDLNIGSEDMQFLKDNLDILSLSDKAELTGMALSNFSIEELLFWKDKASDGLSSSELETLKELVYKRLSSEDIERLKHIANKYVAQLKLENDVLVDISN